MGEITLQTGPKMFYEEHGEGPTLLQIGGGGLSKKQFSLVTPFLTEHFRVLDVDLPGYGESDPATHEGTINGWADDAAQFLNDMGTGPVHVHGISTGGSIALALAARHPSLVDKLIAGACFGRLDAAARLMRATWKQAARDGGMRAATDCIAIAGYTREFFDSPQAQETLEWMRGALGRTQPSTFISAMESLEDTDQEDVLGDIQAPTLLMGGALDQMTPVDTGPSGIGLRGIHERIQDSTLAVFTRQSHCYFVEVPQATAELMIAYLSGQPIAPSADLQVES